MLNITRFAAGALGCAAMIAAPSASAQYRSTITHDAARCAGGASAVRIKVSGVESNGGTLRVQSYRGTARDWLQSGRWINRIELPARKGSMTVCMPLPGPGTYGIAIRHDANGNGKTDVSSDGGGMSNNPSINVFNLGKPSYKKTAFRVGSGVSTINITMKYL